MDKERTILEVSVDRLNEKGVFMAEQILNIFHNTLEEHKYLFWKTYTAPEFSFEMANIGGVIRFFFTVDSAYAEFLENQIYAHYPNVEIRKVEEYIPESGGYVGKLSLIKDYISPIKIYTDFKEKSEKESVDPFSSITSALQKGGKDDIKLIQVRFSPIHDTAWKSPKKIAILTSHSPKWLKKAYLSKYGLLWKIGLSPFMALIKLVLAIVHPHKQAEETGAKDKNDPIDRKLASFGFSVGVSIGCFGTDNITSKITIKEAVSSLNIFSISGGNGFKLAGEVREDMTGELRKRSGKKNIVLNSSELAGLVHLPTIYVQTPGINWVTTKMLEPPQNLPLVTNTKDVTPLGITNFRGGRTQFGMLPTDRRRHVYIIGKTGMGKSTLLENMIYDDIMKGRGVAVIDPHGDLADTILANIPKSRTNDVIVFDPADYKNPIAFNMLENVSKELQPIVASGLLSIFKKMFAESWGPRLEYILRNTIITLLQVPDSTLMTIPMMLTQTSFRRKIIAKIQDPLMEKFWTSEFEAMEPKQMVEAVSPILNKVGQFLSSTLLRNILGQPKNPFSLRWIMDNKKIFIVNLSKGKIGEDSSALLGAMMVTKFQIEAMGRADIEEDKREDFYLYVDEFQNFATDSFATILSEARKYKLNLVMANQYIEQMSETVRGAVFGNVGTIVSFQVGFTDAAVLSGLMDEEVVSTNDLVNLGKYDIYTKLLVNGMPSKVFSATTFGPIKLRVPHPEQKKEVIMKVSREKYSKPVEFVEKKINDYATKIVEDEKKFKKEQEAYKERMKEEKKKKFEESKKTQ